MAAAAAGRVLAARAACEELNDKGARALGALCNALIESSFTEDSMHWGVFADNKRVRGAVMDRMRTDRLRLLANLEGVVVEIREWYEDLKEVLAALEEAGDRLAAARGAVPPAANGAWRPYQQEALVGRFVTELGQDLCCKEDILADLRDRCTAGAEEAIFRAGERDDLLLYLSVWTERPYVSKARGIQLANALL